MNPHITAVLCALLTGKEPHALSGQIIKQYVEVARKIVAEVERQSNAIQ